MTTMFLNLCGLREACPLAQVSLQTTACDSVLLTCLPYGCQTPLRLPPAPRLGPAPCPGQPSMEPTGAAQGGQGRATAAGGASHQDREQPLAGLLPWGAPTRPHRPPLPTSWASGTVHHCSLPSCPFHMEIRPHLCVVVTHPLVSPGYFLINHLRQQASAASLGVDVSGGIYKTFRHVH